MKSSKLWVKAIQNFREIVLYGYHHFSTLQNTNVPIYKFGKCKVTKVEIVIFV